MEPHDHDLGKTNVELINFRLDQLQLSTQAINATLASLANSVNSLQNSLPDRFLPRVEFNEVLRQKEIQQTVIDRRLDQNDEKNHAQDEAIRAVEMSSGTRGWTVAGALFSALVAVGMGAFNLLAHHP